MNFQPDATRLTIVNREESPEAHKLEKQLFELRQKNVNYDVFSIAGMMAALYNRDEAINQILLWMANVNNDDPELVRLARHVYGQHLRVSITGG